MVGAPAEVATAAATVAATAAAVEPGAVELQRVTKRFGVMKAVDDLTLAVRPGEFLSLLGPSGCGKTTTLRMLAGFEHPETGAIRISGRDVAGVPPHKRDVNTVFQHYALFPHMTVAENVAYGLRQQGVGKAETSRRVTEALAMVSMDKRARSKPRQLSGGQQQRIALARALVNRPSVLLLDEPLGALDRKLRQEMQIELKLIQSQVGTTFIYVTHDQEEALSMSDRIAVMLDGRVQQFDTPDRIYDLPETAFVAGFIGSQNFLPGTARGDGHELDGDGFGVSAGRVTAGVTAGGGAVAAVRPEHVVVTPATGADVAPADATGTGGVNRVAGTLAGVSHLGELLQFVVRVPCAGGRELELLSRRPRAQAARLRVGDPVVCSWQAEHAHVFATDGAGAAVADPAGHVLAAG